MPKLMLVPVFGYVAGALRHLLDQSAAITGLITGHALLVVRVHPGEIRAGIYFCRIGEIRIRI